MNYKFSNEANLELHRAVCYFKLQQNEGLFLDDLIKQLKRILSMPELFQVRYKKVRIVSLEYFNYSIHYTVFRNEIIVLRILNQNQDF
ncbi:type II toxin-antitoxin system RelE/ParE family toxin [Jejuia pallidilutea]|uniref:type II toxin-antitoxin system RelE/ParE family toxin n=1 Tax=Jejuia pallidilutea TaxID=504487 RepID=UPI000CFD06C0|nr:type II toxin-antitoxin system RelE/ParE family toxin [Jejuia pallidilutea]